MDKFNIQYKKIKKGYITKLIKSKILRDDIPCNISECVSCDNNLKQLSISTPLIFLTSSLIESQIDALENFKIIDNCIIPQSEYNTLLNLKDSKILNRLNFIMENRNIYIYPNEFQKDIANLANETSLKKSKRNEIFFDKTIKYYEEHLSSISKDYTIIILYNEIPKDKISGNNIFYYDMLSFAKVKMKESPDLFNYVANISNSNEDHNKMDIEIENNLFFTEHLTEGEMKSNIKQAKMFQGKVYFEPGIYNTAVIKSLLFDKDIVIEGEGNLNRAMNGDIVCFTLYNESEWKLKEKIKLESEEFNGVEEEENENKEIETKALDIREKIKKTTKQPTGHIEGILRFNRNIFSGTIYNPNDTQSNSIPENLLNYLKTKDTENTLCIFIPIDSKFPFFLINLYERESYYNQRILIKYDNWKINSPLPNGHFILKLGKCLDIPVENNIILYEHNVDINPFSKKIIDSMPREDIEFKCPEEELEKRLDLRDRCICSIDPPGCKDIDDALHCKILPNQNYELGVHIADVSHYVKAGSEVDKIASKNCNTIYLVHKRTDMLPKVLTENLCSLVGGKERLAFSVIWEFDYKTLNILNVKYGKSVIKSRAALTYEKANNIMNDLNDNSELAIGIRLLNKITKDIKRKRIEAGALILASNEMKFNLNQETNTITDISMYKTYETNSLVEECMLLANVWVAKKIYESFPSCAILRRHPPPKEKELNNFTKILNERGYEIDTSSSLNLSNSLNKINKEKDPFFNKLIRSLLTRTMNQAKYFPSSEYSYEDFYHYGLAMEIYTHFTSPIRRYSDILVHRLLSAALEIDYLPIEMTNKIKNDRECNQMNKQNRVGFFCGKDSNYFSAFIFFMEHENERNNIEIVIHSIDKNFIKGISVKYGIEANLDFNQIGVLNVDEDKKIVYLQNQEKIELFDHVNVQIQPIFYNYRYEIKYFYQGKI